MTFYGKAMLDQEDTISQSDTASQRVREREKNEPITSSVPLCLFHMQLKRSC